MYDRHDLYRAMGKIAIDAMNNSMPSAILFGTVTSVSPLKINIEQKMTLDSSDLILTLYIRNLELKKGDRMILLRAQGGQQFVILDKI